MTHIRKWIRTAVLFALYPVMSPTLANAQPATPTPVAPDCSIPITLSSAASTSPLDNRYAGCTNWVITYTNTGYTVLSLALQSAPDSAGTPGSWVTFAGTVVTGINPNTAITQNSSTFSGYYPWIRVTLSGLTGSGTVRGVAYGWKTAAARAGGGGGNPTGVAGGCLGGNYPNPTIAGITIAAGVVFVDTGGCLGEDATNFTWDNTAKTLRVATKIQFNGTTSAFPMLRRSNANLQVRLADDSGFGGFTALWVQNNTTPLASVTPCVAGRVGSTASISDALAPAWGAPVVAGGAAFAQIVCNGVAWTVAAI